MVRGVRAAGTRQRAATRGFRPVSRHEEELVRQLSIAGLHAGMVREFRFHETRKWRFDIAWPREKVAVEVEGGAWVSGRHNRAAGMIEDCRKYAEAAVDGWAVLRVMPEHIRSGEAIAWLRRFFLS